MRQAVAIEGQTIFDIALQEYGTIAPVNDILQLNGLDLNVSIVPGMVLMLPNIQYATISLGTGTATADELGLRNYKIVAGDRQTIFDIALQEYGSVEGVASIAADNGIDFNSIIQPGQQIAIKQASTDPERYEYYKAHKIEPATGAPADAIPAAGDYNDDFNEDFLIQWQS